MLLDFNLDTALKSTVLTISLKYILLILIKAGYFNFIMIKYDHDLRL